MYSHSHKLAADHPVRGIQPVGNSSKEHHVSIFRNEVMALWIPQHFPNQTQLITKSHRRTVKERLGATFAHIYCTNRINPSLWRFSIEVLQEVGLLLVSL